MLINRPHLQLLWWVGPLGSLFQFPWFYVGGRCFLYLLHFQRGDLTQASPSRCVVFNKENACTIMRPLCFASPLHEVFVRIHEILKVSLVPNKSCLMLTNIRGHFSFNLFFGSKYIQGAKLFNPRLLQTWGRKSVPVWCPNTIFFASWFIGTLSY